MLSEGHVNTLTVLFLCPHSQSQSPPSVQKNQRLGCLFSYVKSSLLLSQPVHDKGSGPPCWGIGVGSGHPILPGEVQGQRRELFCVRGETNRGELPRREVSVKSVTAVFGLTVRWLGGVGRAFCLTT